MQQAKVRINNHAGIHCRPASVILSTINAEFPTHKFYLITSNGVETELNSILSLISLGLHEGTEATLRVEGDDEAAACDRIADLFEFEFDFPPR